MDKQNSRSTLKTSKHQDRDKKSLFFGGIIVVLIAISPLIFYSYKSFPDNAIWETSFFTWETVFGSWIDFSWYLFGKLIPIYLLLIWFFTCKHWWHWIILVPLAMYIFQLWGIINENRSADEVELIYLFPLMMVVIPLVYLVRAKLFNKVRGTDLKAFEEDLMTKKTMWQQIRDLFR